MTVDLAIDFGPIIHAGMVSDAVHDTIDHWIETYLAEMARRDSDTEAGSTLPPFRSYPISLDTERFAEEQLPACVIVVPGIVGTPVKRGNGSFIAEWQVGLGIGVTGQNKARTARLAQLYTVAVRSIILQKHSLSGGGDAPFADGVTWDIEHYMAVDHTQDARTMVIGMLQFRVMVSNAASAYGGPTTPIHDGEPPTGWPTVAETFFSVDGYTTDQTIPPNPPETHSQETP
jgi:hypothetical protein